MVVQRRVAQVPKESVLEHVKQTMSCKDYDLGFRPFTDSTFAKDETGTVPL